MEIIEEGTHNQIVRDGLSEKKKIKDVFLVVVKSINLKEQRTLVASLLSVVGNLCYGTNHFRNLLKSETPTQFFGMLKDILESASKKEDDQAKEHSRVLVKQSLLAFLGNLTVDP